MIKKIIELNNNNGFKKYFKNTSWLFGEKIFRMSVGMIIGILVARYLGPEKFGLLNYVISFVGLFGIIATLGINNIVVKKLVNNPHDENKLLGTSFVIRLIGSIILMLILTLFIQFTNNDNITNMYIYILAFSTVILSFNVIDLSFQSKVKSKFVVYSNIFTLVITSIIKLVLISMEAPLISFVIMILLDSLLLAIFLIYFYYKDHNKIATWFFDKEKAKELITEGFPLVLAGFAMSIYLKIDQVMINEMLGNESGGYYAAAVRLSESLYFIPIAISISLFPSIINSKKDIVKYKNRMQALFSFLIWFAILIAIPLTYFSDFIIDVLYGEAYQKSANVLMIHIWAGIFVFLGEATSRWFINENLQKLLFYRTALGAVLNIILNYYFIQSYGIYGAALATIISQIFSVYIFNLFGKKTFEIFKIQTKSFFAPYYYIKQYLDIKKGKLS